MKNRAAAYMAVLRAIASNLPPDKRKFEDPYAKLFLPPSLKLVEWLSRSVTLNKIISWYIEKRWTGALTSCIARTKLIDNMLTNLVQREGVNQVIIFGAQYDCRVHRLKLKEAPMFVEVDDPQKQERKRQILENSTINPKTQMTYLPVNFHKQHLDDVLPGLFHSRHYKTLFIWEGVSNYFTAPVASKIFKYFKTFPSGTTIIFNYVDEEVLYHPDAFPGASNVSKLLQQNNEFWNFGIDPDKLEEFLAAYNLKLIHHADANRYRKMYFGESAEKMKGYEFYRVVMAVVK